jgi:hypothetical protein
MKPFRALIFATVTGFLHLQPLASARATQQAYLKSSNSETNDSLGYSIAVSGDTIVIGAPSEDSNATGVNGDQNNNESPDSGAAYIFVRTGTNWVQQAYLKPSNTTAGSVFGLSVAIHGDLVVVGSTGESSNATGVNGDPGTNDVQNSGAAYVFVRNGTNWTQQAYLKASNTGPIDNFGSAVAVFEDLVVVGARNEASAATGVNGVQTDDSANDSGAAYVFVRQGTNWTQQAYLKASNTGPEDQFGFALTLWGNTIVVGAHGEASNAVGVNGNQTSNSAFESGAAYVFVRDGTSWIQQAYLKASNTASRDHFAWSLALSGDTLVVGAYGEDSNATAVNGDQSNNNALTAGAAYVFVREGTNWAQQAYLKASNAQAGDFFGESVAISGDTIVVGASLEDGDGSEPGNNSLVGSGAAYVFTRSGTNWIQQDYLKASNPGGEIPPSGPGDGFGESVAVSGSIIVVAAPGEDSDATGLNGDQGNNNALNSGAAYVFHSSSPVLPIELFFTNAANTLTLHWAGAAALEEAVELQGSWRTITNAISPFETPTTNQQQFFRLRQINP